MKKFMMVMSAAALAFTLVGCNSAATETKAETSDATETQEPTVIQGEIAWSDSEDAAAAAANAGQSGDFVVPYPLPIGAYEWSEPNFTSMDNVVQADFDGKGICCSIRKGEGVSLEDLSADLNEYHFDWTQDVDGIIVSCHGYEEGIANYLEWEANGCSYNVWCVSTAEGNLGMNGDEVYAMVTSIR